MHEQVAGARDAAGGRSDGGDPRRCGAVAVAAARGCGALFDVARAPASLDGGPTLNPSTYELLAGIHDVTPRRSWSCPTAPT